MLKSPNPWTTSRPRVKPRLHRVSTTHRLTNLCPTPIRVNSLNPEPAQRSRTPQPDCLTMSSIVLVPKMWQLRNIEKRNMTIRTANNGQMRADVKGGINLSHLGIKNLTAHRVPDLAEPLLSGSAITDTGKNYVSFSERETGFKVRKLTSDNGREYISKAWDHFCQHTGIKHSMGPPHSPEMNGTAERFNRTLLNCLLPTLFHANLPTRFWEDAAANALRSINLSPSRVNPGQSSPFSLWTQQPSSYSRLWILGCKCIRLVTGPSHGGKLTRKGNDCLFFWTLPDGDRWLVWDLKLQRTVKSHDVVFLEDLHPEIDSLRTRAKDWFNWFDDQQPESHTSSSGSQLCYLWERPLSKSIHNVSKNLTDPDTDDSLYPPVISVNQVQPTDDTPRTPSSEDSVPSAPPAEV